MTSVSKQERYSQRYNKKRDRILSPVSNAKPVQNVIKIGGTDITLLLVIGLLLLIGVVMVFCAGYYKSSINPLYNYDMYYFLKQQGMFAIAGFCVMMIMSSINYRVLLRFAIPLYLVANALLIAVVITGVASHGATRWLDIPGLGIRFQPSEFSKIAIISIVPYMIYKYKNILKKWPGFLFICGIVGVTFLLVLYGGLSTALIVALIGFGTIFIASPYMLRFILAAMAGVGGLISYIKFSDGFRGERFAAWLDPFSDPLKTGFQTIQSLYAIASGGLFGLGIGKSRQKSFVPEPHNDFIFSIICEELGLVGAALVLILFGVLIWRGIQIAIKAPDLFGSLVASGIVLMIASQVIINVAVVTNSIPNTGVTMPLISYGGTSLLITMFLLGVLLNISRYSKD